MRITAINRNHNNIHPLLSKSCRHNGFLVFQLRELLVGIVMADCVLKKFKKLFRFQNKF